MGKRKTHVMADGWAFRTECGLFVILGMRDSDTASCCRCQRALAARRKGK